MSSVCTWILRRGEVDAKSGIEALDRTQPLLPIDFGKIQKHTFDYARMGTTDLYGGMVSHSEADPM
jgi:hypothetical protein